MQKKADAYSLCIGYVMCARAVQLIEIDFGLQQLWKYNNRDKTIIEPHSSPFPALLFHSSIKGHFFIHVQVSKIM